jgi:hypothetical protein
MNMNNERHENGSKSTRLEMRSNLQFKRLRTDFNYGEFASIKLENLYG